jgi:DNA-binding SARP family transcriptional activator
VVNRLVVNLLGSVAVSCNGQEHLIKSNQMRTTLTVLALSCAAVVSIEQFVDELWEGSPPSNAKNALQANIARLRRFLDSVDPEVGGRVIRTSTHGYWFDFPSDHIDIHAFEARADLGASLLASSPTDAVLVLEDALRMWRGPALLDVVGGPRCRSEAVLLNERRLDVHKTLIEARMIVGTDRGVVSELKQLVTKRPADERLSALLMLALYRGGRQGEALAVYQMTRSWLHAELGLEPGPELRRVQQAILLQDQTLEFRPAMSIGI